MILLTTAHHQAKLFGAPNMKNFNEQVKALAELLGDPKGTSPETVDYIACEMQVGYTDVRQALKEAA
jgi:hypothetical protein